MLRPRFHVPSSLRTLFFASIPAIVAGWATNGLFLALGASLVTEELGGTTHIHAGAVIFALALSGVVSAKVLYRRPPRVITVYGTTALGVGTASSLVALALHSYSSYIITVAVVGSGFGTAFMGVLRTLMPHTDPSERAAVMSVIYVISYLAFGAPTILAGVLVPIISLPTTMMLCGAVIVLLCLISTVFRLRSPRGVEQHSATG